MKNHKKRQQREEVRKILATMRLELAAQRLAAQQEPHKEQLLRLNELIHRARQSVAD